MKSNVSKAQQEVWEWKEKAYEEIKHLSLHEQLLTIHKETRELVDRIKKKKQQLNNRNNHSAWSCLK